MSAPQAPLAPTAAATAPTAGALVAMADALPWPLLLLRRDGSLLHGNRAAHTLLRGRQPLLLAQGGQVLPSDNTRRSAFAAACDAASLGAPRLLHWPGAQGAHTATLSRLHTPPDAPAVLMLALSPPLGRGTGLRTYAEAHALSTAETRVLARLARGESTTQAAGALGVAPSTVRSQAASLRRKTGHGSLAELLRALALLPPLAADPEGE